MTERSFCDVARRDFENRMAVNFAVRLNGTLIGEAVLYNFDYRGSAELGRRIDKAYAETATAPRLSGVLRNGVCIR